MARSAALQSLANFLTARLDGHVQPAGYSDVNSWVPYTEGPKILHSALPTVSSHYGSASMCDMAQSLTKAQSDLRWV